MIQRDKMRPFESTINRNSPLQTHLSFIVITLVLLLQYIPTSLASTYECGAYSPILYNINKYNPEFDKIAYSTETLVASTIQKNNLLSFYLTDKDTGSSDRLNFNVVTDNPAYTITPATTDSKTFNLNFKGNLSYNINGAHRYEVTVTACDQGIPKRCTDALVTVPLKNYNMNAPDYTKPVVIHVAINHAVNEKIGILNAFDIDGDFVSYQLSPKNTFDAFDVSKDGTLTLVKTLNNTNKRTYDLIVDLFDDGSCCPDNPGVRNKAEMIVSVDIVEVNLHTPDFIANSNSMNYCETKFRAPENTYFEIEINAMDQDTPGANSEILIITPDVDGRVPQNSFQLDTSFAQVGKTRKAIVKNKDLFDYESPIYGSNTMYIMYYAKDNGTIPRRGYCYMTIEIADVNDNKPIFTQNAYTIFINDGYKVKQWNYRFVAVDADSGDDGKVDYFIMPGSSQQIDVDKLFTLSSDGLLTIKDIIYFDSVPDQFSFQVYAQDRSATKNRTNPVRVNVVKSKLQMLPPFFSNFPNPPEIRNVSETELRGKVLHNFTILMQGDTTNQFLRCYLNPIPWPEWFKFEYPNPKPTLDTTETCVLRVEDPLNYEKAQSMVIYMVAEVGSQSQPNTAREHKTLTIYLKDENTNSPKFVLSTIEASVVEGEESGKVVAKVKAYDLDKEPPYNTITYKIDATSDPDKYFTIDAISGQIKTTSKKISNKKSINLQVIASDCDATCTRINQNSIYVDVRVIDINDNTPKFNSTSYIFQIAEDMQPGFVLGTMDVSDEDAESFFNFSISDSTFGVRPTYLSSRMSTIGSYKGSAEVYLNTYLDRDIKDTYDVEVFVSDGKFISKASLRVLVTNVNAHAPRFTSTYEKTISENQSPVVLAKLQAVDDDKGDVNFVFDWYATPLLQKEWFTFNTVTSELTLSRGLDRDEPFGASVYYLPISVTDNAAQNGSLTTYSFVKIIVNDQDDNLPKPLYLDNRKSIVINEKDTGATGAFYFYDVDATRGSEKITFKQSSEFTIEETICNECGPTKRKFLIKLNKELDRDVKKWHVIEYEVSDPPRIETGSLAVVVGDIDNNPQSSAAKSVRVALLEGRIQKNSDLGTLYVLDKDDWDKSTKVAKNCVASPKTFSVASSGLKIAGPVSSENFPSEPMSLKCTVQDAKLVDADASVDFTAQPVNYVDITDPVAVRLLGVTAEELVGKLNVLDTSRLETLTSALKSILGIESKGELGVVSIRNYVFQDPSSLNNQIPIYDTSKYGCDVYFYAKQAENYISSPKINYLLNQQKDLIGLKFQVLEDLCSTVTNYCAADTACQQNSVISQQSLTIDGNATAFVGIDLLFKPECFCDLKATNKNGNLLTKCFNGGVLHSSKRYCECPYGYEGPNCELLTLTFTSNSYSTSHSYAIFDSFKLCDPTRIEFEFSTDRPKGLLLFNGPINREGLYFIAVEVKNSYVVFHFGEQSISLTDTNVADKNWHRVDIVISLDTVQIILDNCAISKTFDLDYISKLKADAAKLNDNVKLSLGGIPPAISQYHYYHNSLNVFEYEGCIRNLKINGQQRDLKLEESKYSLAQEGCDCKYQIKCTISTLPVVQTKDFPWWIILIIVAGLLLLALILAFAVFTMRRKDNQKKILQMFPDDDIRETIINYADGAGEENTDNFNIDGMKKKIGGTAYLPYHTTDTVDAIAAQSNDQYIKYANEGEGSDAGSLSTLNTDYTDKEQDYEYLDEWGQKFTKLSNIFNSSNEKQEFMDYNNRGYDFKTDRNDFSKVFPYKN